MVCTLKAFQLTRYLSLGQEQLWQEAMESWDRLEAFVPTFAEQDISGRSLQDVMIIADAIAGSGMTPSILDHTKFAFRMRVISRSDSCLS